MTQTQLQSLYEGIMVGTLEEHGCSQAGIQKAAAVLARRTQQLLQLQKKECAAAAEAAFQENQNPANLKSDVIFAIRCTPSGKEGGE